MIINNDTFFFIFIRNIKEESFIANEPFIQKLGLNILLELNKIAI